MALSSLSIHTILCKGCAIIHCVQTTGEVQWARCIDHPLYQYNGAQCFHSEREHR